MIERRYPGAHVGDALQINIGKTNARVLAHVEQDLAPRVYDQAVPEGVPAILMMTDLRGGNNEQSRLDGASAKQHVPMRLARRHRESGRHCNEVGVRFSEASKQPRKAQIV